MSEPVQLAKAAMRRRAASGGSTNGRASRVVLRECRALAVKRLTALLKRMFDQVDDALFELADKSDNNAEQTRYFDAMREVRLKRPIMERRFRDACDQNFEDALESETSTHASKKSDEQAGLFASEGGVSLSLVANDDLEESLAVENMTAKIDTVCARELYALDQRMAALTGRPTDASSPNPVGPKLLCDAFSEACGELDSGIAVKLLILKLFDKFVASDLEAYYRGLNVFLIGKGILPNIAARVIAPNGGGRAAGTRAPNGGPMVAQGFAAVSPDETQSGPAFNGGWPSAPAVGALPATGVAGPAPGGSNFNAASGPLITASAQDLLAMLGEVMTSGGASQLSTGVEGVDPSATLQTLTSLQHRVRHGGEGGNLLVDPQRLAAGTTNILRELKESSVGNDMGRVDSMMIDIVAMLFDGILDDPAIPQPMKGLIGRLQIPVLKVAIIDKTFFSRKFHPARKLLNTVAEVAMGGTDEQDDDCPVFKKLDEIVHRILDEFDDDVRVFKEAADELIAFRASEQAEAESLLEQALQEIQAQERLRFARRIAGEQIARRIEDNELPHIVNEFLEVYWKSFLQLAYIDEGEEGETWLGGIETMDDLVWSISPGHGEADRARLKALLPTLPGRLKEGMARVPMADEFRERLLSTLVRLHLAAIKPGAADGSVPDGRAVSADADGEAFAPTTIEGPPTTKEDPPATIEDLPASMEDLPVAVADPSINVSNPSGAAPPVADDTISAASDEASWFDSLEMPTDGDENAFFDPTGGDEVGAIAPLESDAIPSEAAQQFIAAVKNANHVIFQTAKEKPECEGMGTTVIAARFAGDRMTVAHVGDSRAYRLRNDKLEQLTLDHSLRQELVDQGFLTPDEAETSQRKNYITRAVGVDATVRPDTQDHSIEADDLYLLCSDGLSDLVDPDAIGAILRDEPFVIENAATALVRQANDNGGKDNISVILVRVSANAEPSVDAPGALRWEMYSLTDVGRTRSHNEDSVAHDEAAGLAMVADGMGGYNAGEVASALAVETVMSELGGRAYPIALPEAAAPHEASADEEPQNEEGGDFGDVEEIMLESPGGPASFEDFEDQRLEEIVIQDVDDVGGSVTEPVADQYLTTVRDLKIGTWVEFSNHVRNGVRARLTWISAATGMYLFTNRHGHKVVDATPEGLAVEFRRGTARPLESVPAFDRALSSLMDRLKGANTDPWKKSGS